MDVLVILIKSLAKKLGGAFARLSRGEITAAQWFDISARLLARYHLAALMSGLGRPRLSQDDLLVSWELINGQLQYLDAFRLQIQSAAEFQAGWESRAQSYAQAIKVPYWKGQTKMLPLPAMPAQGTQCMNNCGCAWNIIPIDEEAGDYDCYWERGKNDSCQTCIERERQWNPLQIRGGMLVNTKAYTLKHLAGKHDQKRHSWRYGANASLSKLRQQKRESMDNDWREYKKRARTRGGEKTGYDGRAQFTNKLTTATARAEMEGVINVNPQKWDALSTANKRLVMAHEMAHNSIENYMQANMKEWDRAEKVLTIQVGRDGTRLFAGGTTKLNESLSDAISAYLVGDRFGGMSDKQHNEIMAWAKGIISRAGYDEDKFRADIDRLIDNLEKTRKNKGLDSTFQTVKSYLVTTLKHLAGKHDQKRHS